MGTFFETQCSRVFVTKFHQNRSTLKVEVPSAENNGPSGLQSGQQNEFKHSEMGPMRPNPIQRTARSVHMRVHNYCTQYCTEQTWKFSLLPPDNHHCSDDVCLREGGALFRQFQLKIFNAHVDFMCVSLVLIYAQSINQSVNNLLVASVAMPLLGPLWVLQSRNVTW